MGGKEVYCRGRGRERKKEWEEGGKEKGQRSLSFFIHYCSGSLFGSWLCVYVCDNKINRLKKNYVKLSVSFSSILSLD